MTKKDYIKIARVLNQQILRHVGADNPKAMAVADVAGAIADVFAHDNPLFKRDVFRVAVLKDVV